MYRMVIVCLLVALIAATGCNKAESKKAPAVKAATKANIESPTAATGQPTPAEGKLESADGKLVDADSHVVTIEDWEAQQAKDYPPLPDDDVEFIRAELIRIAPENNFVYDEAANLLFGEGLPEAGLDFEVVLDKVVMAGRKEGGIVNQEIMAKWCAGIFLELQPRQNSQAPARAQEKQSRQSSGGGKQAPPGSPTPVKAAGSNLIFAPSAVGEWKSIREDHPRITTYHNDEYFEYYRFLADGVAELKYYRDGKMVIYKEYTFDYSPRSGKISLFDNSKELITTLVLKMEPGNEDVLFIEFPDKDSITVYEKLGTGRLAKQSDWLEPGGLSKN